jgi:hypothetical protein
MRISQLPKGIRELALLRQIECLSLNHDKGTDDLNLAFNWSLSAEGFNYWDNFYIQEAYKIQTKNYDDVIAIIETKIATMSSRGFESYYLPIGILKDLIREIKDIK